ncbi:RNA-binding protein, putative [Plasmodium reichenowi]|uniref:RNA-binding protein, putative n=1 Tax=Plasmodium reichenowi TaxID=5854 RepID=A0A151LQU3_PLARE|nr:RNA-binding protein, putative [Plasmodium reichenowi]KYO01574.1 RNA-binding protein, putative [Plasmodium reichenowi]
MSLKRFFNFLDDDNKTKKKINTNKNEVDDEKIINDEEEKIKDEKKYKEEGEQEKSEELPKEEKKGGKRRGRKKQTDDKKNDDDNDQNENYKINDQSQTTLNKIEEEKKGNDNKKKRGRKSKKDNDVVKDDTNEHNKDDTNEHNKDDSNEHNKDDTNEHNKDDTNEHNKDDTNEQNKDDTNEQNKDDINEHNKDDTNEHNNNHTNEQNKDIICDQSKNVINNQSTHYGNQNDHGDPPSDDLKNKNDKENINDDKNCKKIEAPSQILLNTPPPPSGHPPTGIQNLSHNSPPVPPACPPPPTPPAPPGQPNQPNYPSQYYNMYNNMNVENYMGYPYYYSQYYNVVPHQTNVLSIDPNKEKQLNNNNSNVSDGGKMKNDLFSSGNNYDKDINTDESNKNMSILGNNVSNYYMNNPINNYYNMYNYNYMNGMNNVNTLNPINAMTYNYYYDNVGIYDNNKMVDENVLNYCSILDKSIELMKKSDKVKEILKTPARLQITQEELNKIEYTEGSEQYNIWFGKYVTDRYDKSIKGSSTPRFVAKYKCNPTKDSGYTKADKSYTSKQYFCIYFARGCCAYGHNCLYKHRIPNENDELEFEASVDIFGREKFNTFKDDMTGVGTFNNDCRTLFIGSIFINNINQVPIIEKILYEEFLPFGNIEYVRYIPNKNIAFIQFTNRVNAEFAKIAMSDQPIENYSTALTIKWAFEIKNQPHNLIQYYNNPYIYGNTNQVISSTWENYLMQQQYGNNHPMYANMNHMYNNTNIYPIDNNNINTNINSNMGVLANTSLSEHQKKINDRSATLNNSLNKIDQMFDIQN